MSPQEILQKEIKVQITRLNTQQQRKVLEFIRSLFSKGHSGESLISFAGSIPQADLESISKAIEDGCEKVSTDEW